MLPFNTPFKLTLLFIIYLLSKQQTSAQYQSILTVKDIVEQTLLANKEIVIYQTKISESKGDLRISQSPFNSKIIVESYKNYNLTPYDLLMRDSYNRLGLPDYNKSEIINFNFKISKKLKFGTEINPGLSLFNYGRDSLYHKLINQGKTGLQTYRSSVYFNVKQPLLLGFGKEYNTFDEKQSQFQYKIAELSYYQTISIKIFESISNYLKYIYSNKNIEIQNNNQSWYESLYVQLNHLVESDALPLADLIYLKAIISSQEANHKESETNLFSVKKNLCTSIGLTISDVKKMPPPPSDFITNEIPFFDTTGYLNKCYYESIRKRSDIGISYNSVNKSEAAVLHAKKGVKQELNVFFGVGYNGIFETSGLKEIAQPFIQNIPGVNYNIGLSFTINPKLDKEKGTLVKEIANRDIEKLKYTTLINQTKLDIYDCFNSIMNYNIIVNRYQQSVLLNKEALENEYTKLRLGSTTLINLIQLKIDYNNALTNLYNAKLNLNLNIIYLRYLTGTLMVVDPDSNISVDYFNLFSLPNFD